MKAGQKINSSRKQDDPCSSSVPRYITVITPRSGWEAGRREWPREATVAGPCWSHCPLNEILIHMGFYRERVMAVFSQEFELKTRETFFKSKGRGNNEWAMSEIGIT